MGFSGTRGGWDRFATILFEDLNVNGLTRSIVDVAGTIVHHDPQESIAEVAGSHDPGSITAVFPVFQTRDDRREGAFLAGSVPARIYGFILDRDLDPGVRENEPGLATSEESIPGCPSRWGNRHPLSIPLKAPGDGGARQVRAYADL